MKRYLCLLLLLLAPCLAFAEASPIALDTAPINRSDLESIKRGGKFFAANCMSCHTLVYLRYDKLAQSVGVSYDKMPVHVTSWPNGITPPDLSLEADLRGVDWIYTYLHSFYQDSTRPMGVNNLLVNNTAMPGIISAFQGTQVRIAERPSTILFHERQWYDLLSLQKQGSMTPDQFDATITDLVNFLAYSAEPYYIQQQWLGWWVLGFLAILLVFAYLLKKEYWKDVKRKK